jgi:hypothetical protein
MPISTEEHLSLLPDSPTPKEFPFEIPVKGKPSVSILIDTQYRMKIVGKSSDPILTKMQELANVVSNPTLSRSERIAIIKGLEQQLAEKRLTVKSTISRDAFSVIPPSKDPLDCYFIRSNLRLPSGFNRTVSALNVGIGVLASELLIPGVTESLAGMVIATAIAFAATMTYASSSFLQRRIGAGANRSVQDISTLVDLSINSFSGARALSITFLMRILKLAGKEGDTQATFSVGVASLVVAVLAIIVSFFLPARDVLSARIQATMIEVGNYCNALQRGREASSAHALERAREEAKGSSMYQRFFGARGERTRVLLDDEYSNSRIVAMPSILRIMTRYGGAGINALQLSVLFDYDQTALEAMLFTLVTIGLIHFWVNRSISITCSSRSHTFWQMKALSDVSMVAATRLKAISEFFDVSYNSFLNLIIMLYFVFDKYRTFAGVSSNITTSMIILGAALFIAVLSTILDLTARTNGLDRFAGFSDSLLEIVIRQATNARTVSNLAQYLTLLHGCASVDVAPPTTTARAVAPRAPRPPAVAVIGDDDDAGIGAGVGAGLGRV